MPVGIDLGGTKIEAIALDGAGQMRFRERRPTPRHDYDATIAAIAGLARQALAVLPGSGGVGIAMPGSLSPASGLVRNANSIWLNGRPLQADLEAALGLPVRLANDANCFVLSEATDGAGAGCAMVFGVIAGTGVGGGVAAGGRVRDGAQGIAGEWGHNPLPGMDAAELAEAPLCYCGQRGCVETWISGPGLAADFARHAGQARSAEDIVATDDAPSRAAMKRFLDRFARSLASVVNILDPDVIVLGGGLSNIDSLYGELPARVQRYCFGAETAPRIVKNRHGDSSGVRGAAWLAPGNIS